jgi:hypothetical protein
MVSFKLQKSQTSVGNVVFTLSWVSAKMEHEGGPFAGVRSCIIKADKQKSGEAESRKTKKQGNRYLKNAQNRKREIPPKNHPL